jgi:hypothetical protein
MKKRPTPTNGKPSAHEAAILAPHQDGGKLALLTAPTIRTKAPSRPTSARGMAGISRRTQRQPRGASACYIGGKPKGPMLENITGSAVAAPTVKRGFVMSELVRCWFSSIGMVTGGMGHTVRLAARLIPCFQHPAHPRSLKTARVVPESRSGVPTMTKVIPLARTAAPVTIPTPKPSSVSDTADTALIGLHAAAESALAAALALLRDSQGTADELQRATGRAIRAATLLKRACAAQKGGAA